MSLERTIMAFAGFNFGSSHLTDLTKTDIRYHHIGIIFPPPVPDEHLVEPGLVGGNKVLPPHDTEGVSTRPCLSAHDCRRTNQSGHSAGKGQELPAVFSRGLILAQADILPGESYCVIISNSMLSLLVSLLGARPKLNSAQDLDLGEKVTTSQVIAEGYRRFRASHKRQPPALGRATYFAHLSSVSSAIV
mgnify:CR=1 FL=1